MRTSVVIAFRPVCALACLLPCRVALGALDRIATLSFGPAERFDYESRTGAA